MRIHADPDPQHVYICVRYRTFLIFLEPAPPIGKVGTELEANLKMQEVVATVGYQV